MARKYPEKYGPLLLLDAGLITFFTAIVVVFMWSIIDSVDLFNPFDDYIDNFDYSDLVYSEMSRKDDIYKTDTNIYSKHWRPQSWRTCPEDKHHREVRASRNRYRCSIQGTEKRQHPGNNGGHGT
jgi:hypothetical protein